MARDYLQFDLQKPPLPFVGNKLRWWRQLKPMIEALPRGTRVFDAFAGCFAVSKMLQRWGRDLRITANDCGRYYRRRLECVKDTNRVISEMLAAGAHNGLRNHYERYAPETEKKLIQICATGRDQISCRVNLYCGNEKTVRARCRITPYDEDACRRWCDGLDVVDVRIAAPDAPRYAAQYDLVILDPPYLRPPKAWGQGDYIGADACRDAREFCAAVIADPHAAVWLLDAPGSDLVRAAMAQGASLHEYDRTCNRQRAHEVLCELRGIRSDGADLPLFAWARKNGLAI